MKENVKKMIDIKRVFDSLKKVEKWVEDHDYRGYEPFDGLSSIFRPITFGNLLLDRILLQLIRQSPINLRPIFGVKPLDSTIGRGYMAWGYCHMFKTTGDQRYRKKTSSCLQWLIENKSTDYKEYSWGKHFDFASRGGIYEAFEPILIWTALIAYAFLEAYETFRDGKYLDVADNVCKWIVKLPRNQTDSGFCMGYHYQDLKANVHNSNMVGAADLARTAKHTGNQEYLEVAKGAEMTNKSGESLKAIMEVVDEVTTMVKQIADAAEQQSAATETISSNVEAISTITQQSSSGAEQSARAVSEMANLAQKLQTLVSKFKTNNQKD